MTLAPLDRWAHQPTDFNRAAAETVFKAMMALPADAALVFGRILVSDALRHEALAKRTQLAAAITEEASRRSTLLRKQLAASAVRKARSGQDASEQLAGLSALIKASNFEGFTEAQRREWARRQKRDLATGRFVTEHHPIRYDASFKGLKGKYAGQLGIPSAQLKGRDQARYQQAYAQIAELVRDYQGMGEDALLHLHIKNGREERTENVDVADKSGKVPIARKLRDGDTIHAVSISAVPPAGPGGVYYDVLAGMGAPRAGAFMAGAARHGALRPERVRELAEGLEAPPEEQEQFVPSRRIFRNLEAGSRFLSDTMGPFAPPKVQLALTAGEHVGRLGPEAQRVIGPSADRAAYRYRGTERAIQPGLRNAWNSIMMTQDPRIARNRREVALHGLQPERGDTWTPSPVLSYFRRLLPSMNLNTLQLKSGVVPPSQGVIINRNGQLTHESVGYGDDWYLPFNLKNLKALQGGEYIRTRTLGGPTTEDVYTGLMSGARGLTVVSHNGVYTVDFNPAFRGGRRFSDKAGRMVGRYGHLLDAVRSGQVDTGGIDPSRMAELRDQAGKIRDPDRDPDGYDRELARLMSKERRSPQLSFDQKAAASLDFLNDYAARAGISVDTEGNVGAVANPSDIVDRFAALAGNRAFTAQERQIKADQGALKDLRAQSAKAANDARAAVGGGDYAQAAIHEGARLAADNQINTILDRPKLTRAELTEVQRRRLVGADAVKTAQNVADALGIRDSYDAAMRKAEKENKAAMTPLQLNGEGYKTALDALAEQFPYYIDRVEFHPWADSKATPFSTDTGYVKPRFNRPAEALAGYFDPFIAARRNKKGQLPEHGKVYAESTRFQNRQAYPRPYETERQRRARFEERREGGAEGARRGRELSPESQRALREEANLAMFRALHDATRFGSAVKSHPRMTGSAGASGTEIGSAFEDNESLRTAAPQLHKVRSMTEDAFTDLAARNPAQARSLLEGANREIKQYGWIDVDDEVRSAFESGGKPAARKKLERGRDALNAPNAEYDIDDNPAFDPAEEAPSERIESVYVNDPDIAELIEAKKLPKELTNDTFTDSADDLLKTLRGKRSEMMERVRRGRDYTDAEWDELDRPARGLIKARQLARRHGEATERERKQAEAATAAAQPTNVTQILGMDLPTYQEFMRTQQEENERRRRELGGS